QDHCDAIRLVIQKGRVGETYAVGGDNQPPNLEIVHTICRIMDQLQPNSPYFPHEQLIQFVTDRPGHDRRYSIDISKIQTELGWQPQRSLETGLRETVQWYLEHPDWITAVSQQPDYQSWIQRNYSNREGGVK
ncbi:MAG: GDP-mannose 4,6-dehydratase, partial [Bellilinea sp.]